MTSPAKRVEPPRAVVTLDVDWAPDYMIDFVAQKLVAAQVCATWFITHASPATERLRLQADLFELGIHPNFMPGSTHGADAGEVLQHCMRIVPEAKAVRMHGLVQSSNLLEQIVDATPINVDVSLFLPHAAYLEPVDYYWPDGRKLLRLPYVWEDDFEMARPNPGWDARELLAAGSGLRIFDFHPVHVFLNSSDLEPYRRLKQLGDARAVSRADAERLRYEGAGTLTAFECLLARLRDHSSSRISDIAAQHQS